MEGVLILAAYFAVWIFKPEWMIGAILISVAAAFPLYFLSVLPGWVILLIVIVLIAKLVDGKWN